VDRMLDVDTVTYLTDDLLAKMDIATMAHSLEGRSPFLDHEFMEFAASLPPTDKLSGQSSFKVGLKAAARGWVPDEILDAPKRGFRLPIHDWLRGELRDYARDVLLDPAAIARGHFNRTYVERLLSEHAASRADHSQGIWTLLMYELWHDHVREGLGHDLTPTS
jgi:asparagine synthase (glutamine-hydrolysing)